MGKSGWPPIRHYAIAIFVVVVLAVVTEGLQGFNPGRQPQVDDVFHDLLGSLCGLGWLLTYDQQMSGRWAFFRMFPRTLIIRAAISIVVGITFIPVAQWAYAYWDRFARFPSLLEFSSEWEMKFVMPSNNTLQIVSPPEGWRKTVDDKVGQVPFYAHTYSGIRIDETYPDWRGYTFFELDIYSELPLAQSIALRIHDLHHNDYFVDRFNKTLIISPGFNHFKILLDDIRQAPVGREMDMEAIKSILLFATRPPHAFTLYIDNIRLE